MLKASVFLLLCRVSKIGHVDVTMALRWYNDPHWPLDASKILDNLGRWWLPLVAYSWKSLVYAELCRHVSGCREILTSKCICRSYSIHIGWFWSFFGPTSGKILASLIKVDCNSWIAEVCIWTPWVYMGDLVAEDVSRLAILDVDEFCEAGMNSCWKYPLVNVNKKLLNIAIESSLI